MPVPGSPGAGPTLQPHIVMPEEKKAESKPKPKKEETVLVALRRDWPAHEFRRTVNGNQIVFTKDRPVELNAAQCKCVCKDVKHALVIVIVDDKNRVVADWDQTNAVRAELDK